MLPLRLSNEPSYCLIYHKNSIDINRNGKIYHFTWRWLFFENTIVNITFEIVKRSIFWSDIPYEWYRLINKKSKIYHFIWQRLFDRKAIVNITFEIVKWAIGQLEFLEWIVHSWQNSLEMSWPFWPHVGTCSLDWSIFGHLCYQ